MEGSIAIVVLTHNRAELLRKCVENVLQRTSPATAEIVIWNNASSDHTAAYLDSLDDIIRDVADSLAPARPVADLVG